MTCPHCGHTGPDVRRWYDAKRHDTYIQCADLTACWARWNAAYLATPAVQEAA